MILLDACALKIVCVGSIELDTDNLLQPYLFWTMENGALRDIPFFTSTSNEAILLDSFMIESMSLHTWVESR